MRTSSGKQCFASSGSHNYAVWFSGMILHGYSAGSFDCAQDDGSDAICSRWLARDCWSGRLRLGRPTILGAAFAEELPDHVFHR